MTAPWRVVIVEDEALARRHLRELVEATPALTLVGEAADGEQAVAVIRDRRPDVLFLDIRMPGRDGLAVLDQVPPPRATVFTTAYDAHAVEAFDLGAADYLLKPFGADRFAKAVARVTARLAADAGRATRRTHVTVRDRGREIPVAVHAIERLSAEDDLVVLHVQGRRLLRTATLRAVLAELDPTQWVRVHRSHAVNLAFVRAIERADPDRIHVRMTDGSVVRASRAGTRLLRQRLAGR